MVEQSEMPRTMPVALIGLLGTALIACSGLCGALVSLGGTILEFERRARTVDLPQPQGDVELTVDLGRVVISPQEAAELDPQEFHRDFDLGFVLHQPFPGWGEVESLTYRDLFVERGSWTGSAFDNEPVRRIRYGEPARIQYQEGVMVNGYRFTQADVDAFVGLYGTDMLTFTNEITVLILDKAVAANSWRYTLADIALEGGSLYRGGANRIVANEGSDFILMQASWRAENLRVEGQPSAISVDRWMLMAENEQNYYVVEIAYMPHSGQSAQVWDNLQAYIQSFHVIR